MPATSILCLFMLTWSVTRCTDGQQITCDHTRVDDSCTRMEAQAWPQLCNQPFSEQYDDCKEYASNASGSDGVGQTFVVLLNSFEKLTWATVGLGRLLAMANSSSGVSFVEPCVSDSEIGGFGHHDWLQLDAYFDTKQLRSTLRPHALVTVEEYVRSMRCARRRAASMHRFDKEKQAQVQSEHAANIESSQMDAEVDPARSLDALIVFVWWEEERRGLTFHPPLGLAHCHTHLLAKGHIQRVRVSKYQSEQQDWYAVHKMKEGTDNRTIDAPDLIFRHVLCADPYALDHSRPALRARQDGHGYRADRDRLWRGSWLAAVSAYLRAIEPTPTVNGSEWTQDNGFDATWEQGEQRQLVMSLALASYRRTALAHMDAGEERWGRWEEDRWMAQQIRVPPHVLMAVQMLLDQHLPAPFLSVHFRAGRILNRGTVDGGEGSGATNRFRRIAYEGTDLDNVLAYPVQCARKLIQHAEALMGEHGLKHVFFATDLVEGMMPELDASNPATTLPLMRPEHRQQVVEGAEEAWHLIRENLNPIFLSSHLLHAGGDKIGAKDSSVHVLRAFADKGLAAILDRELLARGQVFLYAGQYAGRCEATGYSESVRERRQGLGMDNASSVYLSECCIIDSPTAYLPTSLFYSPEAYLQKG